jgi:hypothetical protein
MLLYSIIMLAVAVLFMVISFSIYKGNTDLIHDYHQTKVTDKKAYGKAFGKALAVIAAALFLSGGISLLGDSEGIATAALVVLAVGLAAGIICILRVQKIYNQGLF